jgi:hypothetical protein
MIASGPLPASGQTPASAGSWPRPSSPRRCLVRRSRCFRFARSPRPPCPRSCRARPATATIRARALGRAAAPAGAVARQVHRTGVCAQWMLAARACPRCSTMACQTRRRPRRARLGPVRLDRRHRLRNLRTSPKSRSSRPLARSRSPGALDRASPDTTRLIQAKTCWHNEGAKSSGPTREFSHGRESSGADSAVRRSLRARRFRRRDVQLLHHQWRHRR